MERRAGRLVVAGRVWKPTAGTRTWVFGLGKAAGAMADEAVRRLGPDVEGLVAVPKGYPAPRLGVRVTWGDHPVPGPGSLEAGRALLRAARACGPSDRALFLVSGGGSAVAEVPVPPLTLGAIRRTTELLLASGAPIGSMNAIRRHLSEIKGGRLAVATPVASFVTVAISDVVGDPPADVASGPTVPDPSTYVEAIGVVDRYGLRERIPRPVLRHLDGGAQGRCPETPKPDHPRWRTGRFRFGATNRTALEAAAREARRRGYATRILSARVVGETQLVARRFARALVGLPSGRRRALLSGGETTVTLGETHGKGGRNQEFALAAVPILDGRHTRSVMSAGTDGIDGPTDAAGGQVDGRTASLAAELGVDVRGALARHDAYRALEQLRALVTTGPTGTNVMDLHVGLVRAQSGYGKK